MAAHEQKIAFLASDVDADAAIDPDGRRAQHHWRRRRAHAARAPQESSLPICRFRSASAFIVVRFSQATSGPHTVARIR
jgi:hypothetical protein